MHARQFWFDINLDHINISLWLKKGEGMSRKSFAKLDKKSTDEMFKRPVCVCFIFTLPGRSTEPTAASCSLQNWSRWPYSGDPGLCSGYLSRSIRGLEHDQQFRIHLSINQNKNIYVMWHDNGCYLYVCIKRHLHVEMFKVHWLPDCLNILSLCLAW